MNTLLGIYLSPQGLVVHTDRYTRRFIIDGCRVVEVLVCKVNERYQILKNLVGLSVYNLEIQSRDLYVCATIDGCNYDVFEEDSTLYVKRGQDTVAVSVEPCQRYEHYLLERFGPLMVLTVHCDLEAIEKIPKEYLITREVFPEIAAFTYSTTYQIFVCLQYLEEVSSFLDKVSSGYRGKKYTWQKTKIS